MVIPAHKQAVVPDDLVNLVPYASRVDAGVLPSRQLRGRGLGKKDWSSIYCVPPVSDLSCSCVCVGRVARTKGGGRRDRRRVEERGLRRRDEGGEGVLESQS